MLFELSVNDPQGGPARHVVITCGQQTRMFEFTPRAREPHEGTGIFQEAPLVRDYDEVTPVMRIEIPVDEPKKRLLLPGEKWAAKFK
jgi:hypothetical protein